MKNKKNASPLAVWAVLLGLVPVGAGAAGETTFSGSAKAYFYNVGSAPLSGGTGGWLWDSPLRLRALYRPDQSFSLEIADEAAFEVQSGAPGTAASLFLPSPSSYRLADFSNPVAGPAGGGVKLLNNLDRLALNFHWGKVDLILGRQVVSFGSARVVNPTDVLAPYNIQTLNQENRSGVDAVRLRYAWEDFGELDMGWVAGKGAQWGRSAAYVRPKFRLAGADLSVLGIVFQDNLMAGLDLQGNLGGAGFWSEAAWVHTESPGAAYVRWSLGCDYTFTDDLYGYVEYHFNGAGQTQAADYLQFPNPAAYGPGTVYLLGRHYLAPSLSWQANPLVSVQAQVLANLTDGSFWALAHVEYNISENWYLDGGLAQPVGSGPRGFLPTSEFGLYAAFQYFAARFYF